MRIFIQTKNKMINKKFSGKVIDLLKKLNINPETVIVVKNNNLITIDDIVENKDTLRLLSVVSGG